jgi:hypothetical protein
VPARCQNQEFQFTGNYGDDGFLEECICEIEGEPTSVVVTVKRNPDRRPSTSS